MTKQIEVYDQLIVQTKADIDASTPSPISQKSTTSGGNRPTSGAKIGFFDVFCPFSFQKTFLQPPEVKLLISSLIFLQTIPN